ncbi:MAG: hypothetical protein ACKO2G_04235 [Verrucomicrobiales bacterium]
MPKSPLPPPTHSLPSGDGFTPAWAGSGHAPQHHETLDSEQSAAVKKRSERGAKISSLVITVMVHVILILILTLIILPSLPVDVPEIQAKTINPPSDQITEQSPTQATVKSKPSAASASARLISSHAPSATAFVPTVNTDSNLANIGTGSGVGLGLGFGGTGSGTGGKVGFFGQTSTASRVAFVIDYSASMKGPRDPMMRKELTKSIKELKPGISYSLIFFAGPVWFAGEDIQNVGGKERAVVQGHDNETYNWISVKGANDWKLKSGKLPSVKWIDASSSNVRESVKHIAESRLIYGTDWDDPLEIALDANPRPDVIYFMTDGVAGDRSMDTAKTIARRAKTGASKVVINCISMMEPKALEPMKVMAKETGGQMTVINQDGSRKVVIGPKK